MKWLLYILGGLMVLLGLLNASTYLADYEILSEYGKGFVWGSILLTLIGLCIIYLTWKFYRRKES